MNKKIDRIIFFITLICWFVSAVLTLIIWFIVRSTYPYNLSQHEALKIWLEIPFLYVTIIFFTINLIYVIKDLVEDSIQKYQSK